MNMMNIQAEHIGMVYEQFGVKNQVLSDISLTIEAKDIVAIMGASGAGKSTLLKIMGGYLMPTMGRVRYGETVLDYAQTKKIKAQRKDLVSFIHQDLNLIDFMTGRDNIELALANAKMRMSEVSQELEQLISRLKLQGVIDKKVELMSGGEQQRVALARALVLKTPFILADEPTGSLDRKNSNEFMAILQEMVKERGVTVVIVTHDEKVANYCDRVIDLEELTHTKC